MEKLLKTILAPGLALALATPAFAQEGATITPSETSNGGETPPPLAEPTSGGQYPVKYAARPLTLSAMTAVPQLDIEIARAAFLRVGSTGFGLRIGGQFGITEDLQVNAVLIPLSLSPSANFGDMRVGGRFRFVKGNFQLGGDLQIQIPTNSDFVGLTPSLVGQFNSGNFRLDVGAGVGLWFRDPSGPGDSFFNELQLPISASLNFGDAFYAQINTGIFLPEFGALRIPLGFGAGYTVVKGGAPMLDLGASFTFDDYLDTRIPDTLNFDAFQVLITGKFYLFL